MKLTKTTLKQIIKEELSKALNEVTEMQPAVQLTDEMNAALSRGEVNEDELMMAAKYNLPWKSQENRQTLNFLKSFEQDLDQYTSAGKHGTARQAINKARKDGLIDKNTWRKLRRKHYRKKSRRNSVNRDALDKMGAKEDPRFKTPTPQKIAKRKGYLPKTKEFEKSVDASTRRGRKPGADPRAEELYKKQLARAKRAEKYAAWKRSQSDGQ